MPPQQSRGLLDVFNQRFGFGAHARSSFRSTGKRCRRNRGPRADEPYIDWLLAQYKPPVPDPIRRSAAGDIRTRVFSWASPITE